MSEFVHASAVIVGERAVLVRGASGSGKSSLALALLARAGLAGCFAALVGDDRVGLVPRAGRLVVRAHPEIAGQIERRGFGIFRIAHEPAAVVGLVVDLLAAGEAVERLPMQRDIRVCLQTIWLPRLVLAHETGAQERVEAVFAGMSDFLMTGKPE